MHAKVFAPLPKVSESVSAVTAPAASFQAGVLPQAVRPPLILHPVKVHQSNLDLTGRVLVRRGSIVSWGGLRMVVAKVRLGVFYPQNNRMKTRYLPCSSVQVVGFQSLGASALRGGREGDPLAGKGRGQREAHPVGNTGITSNVGSAK